MFYIISVSLHFEQKNADSKSSSFAVVVDQAIKSVLGQSGLAKYHEVLAYKQSTGVGEIKVEKRDFHIIWAALSIYGNHFGQPLALLVKNVLEEQE